MLELEIPISSSGRIIRFMAPTMIRTTASTMTFDRQEYFEFGNPQKKWKMKT